MQLTIIIPQLCVSPLLPPKQHHKFYRWEGGEVARDRQMIGQEGPVEILVRHSVPIGVKINHMQHSNNTSFLAALNVSF